MNNDVIVTTQDNERETIFLIDVKEDINKSTVYYKDKYNKNYSIFSFNISNFLATIARNTNIFYDFSQVTNIALLDEILRIIKLCATPKETETIKNNTNLLKVVCFK